MRSDAVRVFWYATILLTTSCGASPDDPGAESHALDGEVGSPSDDGVDPTADDTGTTDDTDPGAVDDTGAAPKDTGTTTKPDAKPATDTKPPPAAAPTFTELYTTLFDNKSYGSNCTGSSCHAPGKQKGLDYSSKSVGYTTTMKFVVAGKPDSSLLVSVLTSGSMPQGRPKISAADLARVRAWVTAGAKND
jgi:hypothetical protein